MEGKIKVTLPKWITNKIGNLYMSNMYNIPISPIESVKDLTLSDYLFSRIYANAETKYGERIEAKNRIQRLKGKLK